MSLFIKFYFTSLMLNMFRTLIHPSSGACDFSIVSPHIHTAWMLQKIFKLCNFYGTVRIFKSEYHFKTAALKLYCSSLTHIDSQNT